MAYTTVNPSEGGVAFVHVRACKGGVAYMTVNPSEGGV